MSRGSSGPRDIDSVGTRRSDWRLGNPAPDSELQSDQGGGLRAPSRRRLFPPASASKRLAALLGGARRARRKRHSAEAVRMTRPASDSKAFGCAVSRRVRPSPPGPAPQKTVIPRVEARSANNPELAKHGLAAPRSLAGWDRGTRRSQRRDRARRAFDPDAEAVVQTAPYG